jgi:hypothetical protein
MKKNRIIKTAMVSSEPYEINMDDPDDIMTGGVGSDMSVHAFIKGEVSPNTVIKKYDGIQSQSIQVLDGMSITNLNGRLYFWARTAWGADVKPFYVITHDQGVYMSTSKRLIKKAIKKDCGCKIK